MKILLTGANGMLAKSVINIFKSDNELHCTDLKTLDITKKEEVLEKVSKLKPEYIINCAAYTAVDKAENDYELAEQVNAIGPANLAIAAKENDATLIHVSTDYVFDGSLDLSKTYNEADIANPNTVYGKTKLKGEKEITKNTDKFYIFRTAWLYGDGNNFVRTMMKLGKTKEMINVVCDQHGSPTNADDLANIIKQSIDKKIPYGIYHTTNLGYTTWSEFAKKIFEYANLSCKVNPVTTKEYIEMMKIQQASRPYNSKLNKDKILKQGIAIPKWEESLKEYIYSELN